MLFMQLIQPQVCAWHKSASKCDGTSHSQPSIPQVLGCLIWMRACNTKNVALVAAHT